MVALGRRPAPVRPPRHEIGNHYDKKLWNGASIDLDAVIVGAGPNGLAAGIILARAGLEVAVYEAASAPGGAMRTEVSAEGTSFDVGPAVFPFATASRFFREWQLERRVDLFTPEISYAHPLDNGDAAVAYRDLIRTVAELGSGGRSWNARFAGLARDPHELADLALTPVISSLAHTSSLARLGTAVGRSLLSSRTLSVAGSKAAALFAGVAAHAGAPLDSLAAAGIGTSLAVLGHAGGWPLPRGGAQSVTDAMVDDFQAHGGRIHLDRRIDSLADIPACRALLLDTSPADALRILGPAHNSRAQRQFQRLRQGPAVFKVDAVLSEPLPWRHSAVRNAATVHVGGDARELHTAEHDIARGRVPESPFVMLVQPTVVDPGRAPDRHVVWAYTRLPQCATDRTMTEPILRQIERFAPGFRDTILEKVITTPRQLNNINRNLEGGDILGGRTTGLSFIRRPTLGPSPWRLNRPGTYICSSAVAPGPGVHGMGGFHAAADALRRVFGRSLPDLAP
ncbi:phytoene desaturase family protein [Leifsonia sp. LS-T14]|uniref:phytoene desaturase family protein n=1 Tax=unclassified Leifsonia TaxID=2663824 RepID=UPI0035A590BC